MPTELKGLTSIPVLPEVLDPHIHCERTPDFERGCVGCKNHTSQWEVLKEYGIQPNMDGIQVYAWPQTPNSIRLLGETLIAVADHITSRE